LTIAQMAMSLYAVSNGYFDKVPVEKITACEAALHAYVADAHADLIKEMNKKADYNEQIAKQLESLMKDFMKNGAW